MNTWSGIYKTEFLHREQIRHNETPGASYQDNGFWFQTFALAERAYFLNIPFYMNRRDNPNSSVHSKSKVYCMNEEFEFIWRFMVSRAEVRNKLSKIYFMRKYGAYANTYRRIGEEFKVEYLLRFSQEFSQHMNDGLLDKVQFSAREWERIGWIIDIPMECNNPTLSPQTVKNSAMGKVVESLREDSISATAKRVFAKLRNGKFGYRF